MKLYAKWIRTSGPPLAESIKRTESLTWCGGLPVPSAKAIRSGILILLLAGCQTPVTPPVSSPPLPPAVSPRRPMAATAAQPAPVPTTSATTVWTQTNLTAVAGFKVYWGTQSRIYFDSLSVTNPLATSLTVSNLLVGTNYFFAATAFNAGGNESDYSNEFAWLAKAIPVTIVLTIQGAPTVKGPWLDIPPSVTNAPNADQGLYRLKVIRY